MICRALAMCSGLPMLPASQGSARPGRCRWLTLKPVTPALGRAPRPVAPSSRISPPAPVLAPGKGLMAVGWLCVSTFISTCATSSRTPYTGALVKPCGSQRRTAWPSITAALSS